MTGKGLTLGALSNLSTALSCFRLSRSMSYHAHSPHAWSLYSHNLHISVSRHPIICTLTVKISKPSQSADHISQTVRDYTIPKSKLDFISQWHFINPSHQYYSIRSLGLEIGRSPGQVPLKTNFSIMLTLPVQIIWGVKLSCMRINLQLTGEYLHGIK